LAKLPAIPERLLKVDALTRREHFHLTDDDDCHFLWEWDGAPYAESATTDFIGNFQKDPRFRHTSSWRYKEEAIRHAALAVAKTVLSEWKTSIFVPVPPSRIKDDPRHDSRLLDTLRLAHPAIAEAHELVVQLVNTESKQKHITPTNRARNWRLDIESFNHFPRHFVVFDDLLTGGSHFSAMKIVLSREFSGVPVSGLFLARRVLPTQVSDPAV
jgi:predicted amidophosphoribosyltransferase